MFDECLTDLAPLVHWSGVPLGILGGLVLGYFIGRFRLASWIRRHDDEIREKWVRTIRHREIGTKLIDFSDEESRRNPISIGRDLFPDKLILDVRDVMGDGVRLRLSFVEDLSIPTVDLLGVSVPRLPPVGGNHVQFELPELYPGDTFELRFNQKKKSPDDRTHPSSSDRDGS